MSEILKYLIILNFNCQFFITTTQVASITDYWNVTKLMFLSFCYSTPLSMTKHNKTKHKFIKNKII